MDNETLKKIKENGCELVSNKRYYCKKCNTIHNLSSKKGMKCLSICFEKPERKTYVFTLANGKVRKTTSIFDYEYVLVFQSGCSHYDKKETYYTFDENSGFGFELFKNYEDAKKRMELFINNGSRINLEIKKL